MNGDVPVFISRELPLLKFTCNSCHFLLESCFFIIVLNHTRLKVLRVRPVALACWKPITHVGTFQVSHKFLPVRIVLLLFWAWASLERRLLLISPHDDRYSRRELFIPFCLWSHSSLDPEFNPVQKCSSVYLWLPTRGPATGQQIWNLVFNTQSFYSLPLTYTVRRGLISHKELVVLTPVSMQSGINLMQRSVNFFPGSGLCTERSQWRIKAKDGKWLITFPGKALCQDLLFQFLMLSSSQSVVGPADSAKLNFKTQTDVQMELK